MNILQVFQIPNRDLLPRQTAVTFFDKDLTALFSSLGSSVKNRIINQGVGIEVEVENAIPLHQLVQWETTTDNSLRNCGYEYKSKFGARVAHISSALNDLFVSMQNVRLIHGKHMFEFTERTSVHVHLDVRNLEENEILSLLALYTVFERSLFEFAGIDRMDNVFTIPLRYASVDYTRHGSVAGLNVNWCKYAAFNLKTLNEFGTIEFRHMEGNSDYKRVMSWVILLSLLVDYCRRTPRNIITEKIKTLKVNSEYSVFAFEVFGAFTGLLNLEPGDLSSAVSDAKMVAQIPAAGGTSLISKKKVARVAVEYGEILREAQLAVDPAWAVDPWVVAPQEMRLEPVDFTGDVFHDEQQDEEDGRPYDEEQEEEF